MAGFPALCEVVIPALSQIRSLITAAALVCLTGPALADRIRNPIAVFSGLDKITGRIVSFEVSIGETVQFGALQVTPRVCWTRPPTETPLTDGFVEVDEVTLSNEYRRIFTGWMFAASPGLHAVEHAVYDVWLTDCKGGTEVIAEPREPAPADIAEPVPQRRPAARTDQRTLPGGRIDVLPPQGVPVQPRQAPTRQLLPPASIPGRDPAGGAR